MAAEKGNHWWELRATHGRELIFSSPEILWEAAKEYFIATNDRKWIKKDWVGKDAFEVERKTDTPYTISGLCIFLDCSQKTFFNYGEREDFLPIVTRIREIIYTQKFEGAAVGAYNPMIISRDLHLRDSIDQEITNINPIVIDWSENSNPSDTKTEGSQTDSI